MIECRNCPDKKNCSKQDKNSPVATCYRKAADRVWEMANQYKEKGINELSNVLFELSQEIHDLARSKELDCVDLSKLKKEKN